jgi:uncharacterized protein YbjT (DUF2867 family)
MTESPAPLAVTGSTGRLGGRVARLLAARGVEQRLLVRDPARAPQLPGVAIAQASYADADASRRALEGVDVALMVSGSEAPDRVDHHGTFIDAAVDAGVRQLVYVSFVGAGPDATFTLARDHGATEQHVRDRGIGFTFLRDNLYADFFPFMVGDDDVLRGPAGDGRVAAVAQDDLADAIVAVLTDPARHEGRTYDLTGPAAVSLGEVAATLSMLTGRIISYRPETVEEAYASRAHYGAPDWQVEAWVSTYLAIADGSLAAVSTAVPDLTGHPATPLDEVVRRSLAEA